jgi:predicted metal-binding protein
MKTEDKATIQEICLAHKAVGSAFIDPQSIVFAHWTRYKCRYGCPSYNTNLCCPPHAPTLEETRNIVSEYTVGLLVHFTGDVQKSKNIAAMEREIFLLNYYKVIGLGAGPCKLCKECTLANCEFPQHARPSMEACGIDVYATVRQNGFGVDVLDSKDEVGNCYGLLLIE